MTEPAGQMPFKDSKPKDGVSLGSTLGVVAVMVKPTLAEACHVSTAAQSPVTPCNMVFNPYSKPGRRGCHDP